MSPSFDPIAPWPLIVAILVVVVGLTLWAYARRLRGTTGRWRWVALGLRMSAVLMCLLALLKPAIILVEKARQEATIVFLLDDSASMTIADEANNRTRFAAARASLAEGQEAVKDLQARTPRLQVRSRRFAERLHEEPPQAEADKPPAGTATAVGSTLEEMLKESAGARIVAAVLLTDGASNTGAAPLQAAQRLRGQTVPVIAVGFGSENAGTASRDLVARELVAGPVVFVKNQPAIRGVIAARGFANRKVEVGLYVEDERTPVATKTVDVRDANATIPITDLKWTPTRPGETRLTLRVTPMDGELVRSNNVISTYVSVQSGGLGVLYLAGPGTVWEQKFLTLALDAAPEIQANLRVMRKPSSEDPTALPDEELTPGKYDVYLIGDLPADFLTPLQQQMMRRNVVDRGAGLMMLGGQSSFGAGGWAGSALASLLPTAIGPGDGQDEPKDGLKVVPNPMALDRYVMRIGTSPADTQRLWADLPPLTGANRLGPPREAAVVLATSPSGTPLFVAQDLGAGRVLAFAGETWPWARWSDEARTAHARFWRQAIFWLAHKEDQGTSQVKLSLDRRRVALGQKIDVAATARSAEGAPIPDVTYETVVEPVTPSEPRKDAAAAPARQSVSLFNQGTEARGPFFATGAPGEFRMTVVGRAGGAEIGRDSARFLVYQDDRELENPAADFALLRQIAEITGGTAVAPEQLARTLRALKIDDLTDVSTQREVRLWDNWPFLLIFTALLAGEWFLRKYNGWV
jgi:hypothetical protein